MTPTVEAVAALRSRRWFVPADLRSFGHRSRAKQMGWAEEDWKDRPIIAILNTWSELNPCHIHFRMLVDHIKKGVYQAGGFPVEVPVLSLSETFMKPTTMFYRNLLAMETEEVLRCHPIDGSILLGGCDKNIPALLMGAITANLPTLFVPGGPMLRGNWHGKVLGSGSDSWKYWDELRAGNITESEWCEIEDGIARSHGHCMTMGTASTMTAIAEALGFCLPGASTIPASDSAHPRMAAAAGRQIVANVWAHLTPDKIATADAFHNALVTDMAIGGSTNAIVHLLAMARRAGVKLDLPDFDRISAQTPWLLNLRPAGEFLMEDFYYAGGLSALLKELGHHLRAEALTVTGKSIGENIASAQNYNQQVIRPLGNALSAEGGTTILSGNICPNGAVIKHAAAQPHLLQHTGPAIVFANYNELAANIDDPDLDVTADSVIVLQSGGPVGAPGMPEWGMLPIPKKLLEQGVRDMLRISDARMSGTSYGACVLHVAPESAVGGPFALVRTGDTITLDVPAKKLTLNVSDEELAKRKAAWQPPAPYSHRGYASLFINQVTQADEGCDFKFLHPAGNQLEPQIH
jgi:dihydroxy-acid dehydratase